MDLQVGCGDMDWIELAQDRQVAGTCECGNEPSASIICGDFLTSCKPVSFSKRTLLYGVRLVCSPLLKLYLSSCSNFCLLLSENSLFLPSISNVNRVLPVTNTIRIVGLKGIQCWTESSYSHEDDRVKIGLTSWLRDASTSLTFNNCTL
jgi:hypothetical protein